MLPQAKSCFAWHRVRPVNESIGGDRARLIGHCGLRRRKLYLRHGISRVKEQEQSWLPQKRQLSS
jgi:hypothetical protein